MRFVIGFFLLIFLAFIGIFALQNTTTVSVRFLKWGLDAPFAIVAVAIYLLGMISGWSVVAFLRRSIRRVTAETATQ